jgi:hypothetical protein
MIDCAMDRQTGRTTQQMIDAPPGAVFVWVSDDFSYPRQLAKKIGREYLLIKSISWLHMPNAASSLVLRKAPPAVVIDHEAKNRLNSANIRAVEYLQSRSIPVL